MTSLGKIDPLSYLMSRWCAANLQLRRRVLLSTVVGIILGCLLVQMTWLGSWHFSSSSCVRTSEEELPVPYNNGPGFNVYGANRNGRTQSNQLIIGRKVVDVKVDVVNHTWVQLRKELLSRRGSEDGPGSITKVLLLAYMRGGSTFLMDLFNQHPNTSVVWHEALDSFYAWYFGTPYQTRPITYHYFENLTRRFASDIERSRLTRYFDYLLSMDIDNIPVHTLAHKGFRMKTKAFRPIVECMPFNFSLFARHGCYHMLNGICENSEKPAVINMSLIITNRCNDVIEALRMINPTDRSVCNDSYRIDAVDAIAEDEEYLGVKGRVEQMVGQPVKELKSFVKYHHCVRNMEAVVRPCWSKHKHLFNRTNLVAAKVLRFAIPDFETLVQRTPDIRIVHFIRDPRSVASSRIISRMGDRVPPDSSISDEAKVVCTKMRNDVADKLAMESKYPGLFLTKRYEDYVQDSRKTIVDIFRFVGREIPDGIFEWFNNSTNAAQEGGLYETYRTNATERIDRWKGRISYKETLLINKYCSDILEQFGYDQ